MRRRRGSCESDAFVRSLACSCGILHSVDQRYPCARHNAMRAFDVQRHTLTSALNGVGRSATRFGRFIPQRKKFRYPLQRRSLLFQVRRSAAFNENLRDFFGPFGKVLEWHTNITGLVEQIVVQVVMTPPYLMESESSLSSLQGPTTRPNT